MAAGAEPQREVAEEGEMGAVLGPHREGGQERRRGWLCQGGVFRGSGSVGRKQCAGRRFPVTNALFLPSESLQSKGEGMSV